MKLPVVRLAIVRKPKSGDLLGRSLVTSSPIAAQVSARHETLAGWSSRPSASRMIEYVTVRNLSPATQRSLHPCRFRRMEVLQLLQGAP